MVNHTRTEGVLTGVPSMRTVNSIEPITVAMSTRTCQRNKEANSETIEIIVAL